MPDQPSPSYTPEVIASSVWEAIKDVPGLADLHRTPLHALSGKVGIDRLQPVRLDHEADGGPVLEIHIVVEAGAHVPTVARTVAEAGSGYLIKMAGAPVGRVAVYVDDVAGLDE
jgi:uncharacterized alkaline shock family protein YloU